MNRQKSIAFFAVIAAIAMTTIGLTDFSSTSLAILPSESEDVDMLGHVEYTVFDPSNEIKHYMQGDNAVANEGKDCVGALAFGAQGSGNCIDTTSKFTWIAVGNGTTAGTIPANTSLVQLTNSSSTDGCGYGASQSGELGRMNDTSVIYNAISDNSGATGSKVEIETPVPFDIVAGNATTIFQSAIYNAENTQSTGQCTTVTKASQNMFSIQELNPTTGIAVTAGDSLSVKWTITIG